MIKKKKEELEAIEALRFLLEEIVGLYSFKNEKRAIKEILNRISILINDIEDEVRKLLLQLGKELPSHFSSKYDGLQKDKTPNIQAVPQVLTDKIKNLLGQNTQWLKEKIDEKLEKENVEQNIIRPLFNKLKERLRKRITKDLIDDGIKFILEEEQF